MIQMVQFLLATAVIVGGGILFDHLRARTNRRPFMAHPMSTRELMRSYRLQYRPRPRNGERARCHDYPQATDASGRSSTTTSR